MSESIALNSSDCTDVYFIDKNNFYIEKENWDKYELEEFPIEYIL